MKYSLVQRAIITIAILLLMAPSSIAQLAVSLDFDVKDDRTKWSAITLPARVVQEGTAGNALSMGPSSVFSSRKLENVNIRLIIFSFKAFGNDASPFVTSVEISKDGASWVVLEKIESNADAVYQTKTMIVPDIGYSFVRWNVGAFTNGSFLLDDIQLIPFSIQDVAQKTKQLGDEQLSRTIESKIDALNRSGERNEAIKLIADLKKTYVRNLFVLQHVYDKASGIQITEKTGTLIFERSKMANPSEYTEFDKWIGLIDKAAEGDAIIKERIADIKDQLASPAATKAQNVIKFIGNVGNIISGGRLTGIINSFKDIFSTTFSKGNLEANFPRLKLLANGKMEELPENITAVKDHIATGVIEFKKMKSFFEAIEGENAALVELARRWTEESAATSVLIEDVRKQLVAYIKLTDPAFDETKNLEGVLTLNQQTMAALLANVKAHFDSYIDQRFSGFSDAQRSKIGAINAGISEVEEKVDRYYDIAQSFLSLYGDMEIDLKRTNPFAPEHFSGQNAAIEKWNRMRTVALSQATEIKELVRTTYVVFDVRFVPEVQ